MIQEKKEEQKQPGNDDPGKNENTPVNESEDLHKEIKNANAAGLGSLGRSDETIEKTGKDKKEDEPTPY